MAMNRPPYQVVEVLSASAVLPDALFKLWRRQWPLDDSERGCFLTAERMAPLLGWATVKVERGRRDLVRYGLLDRLGGRQHPGWRCFVPEWAWPDEKRPPFELVIRLAARLDPWLVERWATSEPFAPPARTPRKAQPEPIGRLVGSIAQIPPIEPAPTGRKRPIGMGGKGGISSGPSLDLQTVLPVLQVMTGQEDVTKVRDLENEEGLAAFRAVKDRMIHGQSS